MTRLPLLALSSFGLGVLLMIPFEFWFTRLFGVLALFGAVVLGVFAIARPEFLEAESEPDDA